MVKIEFTTDDITKLKVDAIVNIAKDSLLGSGVFYAAIHAAAGAELLEECKQLNGCEIGEAKITKGYNLPAKHIIHTVAPVWNGGNENEEVLLANCYKNCLALAEKHSLSTIAFPAMGTDIYGYPASKAAEIAIREVKNFEGEHIKEITFVFLEFDTYTRNNYASAEESTFSKVLSTLDFVADFFR